MQQLNFLHTFINRLANQTISFIPANVIWYTLLASPIPFSLFLAVNLIIRGFQGFCFWVKSLICQPLKLPSPRLVF